MVRTDPEEGTVLKNGQVVTVYISLGKEIKMQKVPAVEGASLANAKASINGRNLEISVEEDYSSKVAAGYIISQSPEAGTEVEEGSVVKVVVSKGKQTVTLGSYVGYSDSEAIEQIKNLGLNAKSEGEYNETIPAGKVIRQYPKADEEVMPGSTVVPTVSLGPTPPPSSEPTEPSSEPTEPSSEPTEPPDPDNNP